MIKKFIPIAVLKSLEETLEEVSTELSGVYKNGFMEALRLVKEHHRREGTLLGDRFEDSGLIDLRKVEVDVDKSVEDLKKIKAELEKAYEEIK